MIEGCSVSWEFKNENGYFSGVDIEIKDQVVGIWVEDGYYNFDIPFDKFLEIAEEVKKLTGKAKEAKKKKKGKKCES
jgi:hypothetical protein